MRAILVSRRHLQVLDLLAALDHATAEILAKRLGLPAGLVERLLAELEDAGLVSGGLLH